MRVDGKRQWFHSLSTPSLTCYQVHPKRDDKAIEDNGVIPAFKGILVHDCWSPYFRYGDKHSLCGAHLLRELAGVCEKEGHGWTHEMSVLMEMMAKATGTRGKQALSESGLSRPTTIPCSVASKTFPLRKKHLGIEGGRRNPRPPICMQGW